MRRIFSILMAMGLVWAAVDTAKAGTWYVTNQGNNTVSLLSTNGTILGSFSTGGGVPNGIVADSSGNLYVALSNNTIEKYSPNGTDLGTFASTGLHSPVGMVFDPQGNLYVDNYGLVVNGHRQGFVGEYSPTGAYLGVAISFASDYFIAMDSAGNIYLDDTGRGVHKFSPTGADLGLIGAGLFGSSDTIGGMAFDAHGNLYVADTDANFIREFSPTGADLGVFASTGLDAPRGVAFDQNGNLLVVNQGSNWTIREFSPTGLDLGNFAMSGLDAPFDLVYVGSVPEPSAWMLLGIGAATLLGHAGLRRGKRA